MAKKKKKEPISELFVNLFVRQGNEYSNPEYTCEMVRIGVTTRQLPNAALEFAMDNMPPEFDRLTEAEQDEVEKRLRKIFKEELR